VLLSDLIDDPTGKFLKVKMIQKKGLKVDPAFFFDEGYAASRRFRPSFLSQPVFLAPLHVPLALPSCSFHLRHKSVVADPFCGGHLLWPQLHTPLSATIGFVASPPQLLRPPLPMSYVWVSTSLSDARVLLLSSTVEWTPNPTKLTTNAPGVKICSYEDDWYGANVQVIEMDGKIEDLEEMVYIESQLCNAGTKYYGELSEQMLANKDAPGSENGTGLFQTVCSFKIREAYEAMTA